MEFQGSFESLICVLEKAKNDSQRFATLLIITKAIEANVLSKKQRLKLFKAIGFEFPIRLISSSGNHDASDFMKEIGISILSSFSTNEELINAPELNHAVCNVLKLFGDKSTKDNCRISHDCLQFVLSLSVNSIEGKKSILHNGGFEIVCEYYCNSNEDKLKKLAFTTVVHLLADNCQNLWKVNNELLINLLTTISVEIKCDHSDKKFDLIKQVYSLLQTLPKEDANYFYENRNWLDNLRIAIFEILCSKISQELRKPVLLLVSCLTNLFDLKWTVTQNEENKLSVILIRLVCIEISMIIYQCTDTVNSRFNLCGDDLNTLLSCYIIFECTCEYIAGFDQEIHDQILSFNQIASLETSLGDVAKSISEVIGFLQEDEDEFHLACMRIVGSWLNIPYYCLSKTGLEIENRVLNSFKMLVKGHCYEVIKMLSPAIINYGDDEKGKFEIENNDIIWILGNLLCDNDTVLPVETSTLIAQCLLMLSVESKNIQLYNSILENCMQKAIELINPNDVVNKIYISTFVVMIWNKTDAKPLKHAKRFFKSLMVTLTGIHFLDGNQIKCAERNKTWWPVIEQLWPIVMKELNRAMKSTDWVMHVVKSSGFHEKILKCADVDQYNEITACYKMLNESFNQAAIQPKYKIEN